MGASKKEEEEEEDKREGAAIPIWQSSVFEAWLRLDSCNIGIITRAHTATRCCKKMV